MATGVGDLVLVHILDKPAFFARIEDIYADHKPEWYRVELLVLQVPPVLVTWILREEYINGAEFTMGGHKVRVEKVVRPDKLKVVDGQNEVKECIMESEKKNEAQSINDTTSNSNSSNVIPLLKRKKNKQ